MENNAQLLHEHSKGQTKGEYSIKRIQNGIYKRFIHRQMKKAMLRGKNGVRQTAKTEHNYYNSRKDGMQGHKQTNELQIREMQQKIMAQM